MGGPQDGPPNLWQSHHMTHRFNLRLLAASALTLILLYGAFSLYLLGLGTFGALLLILAVGIAIIFGTNAFQAARFIFPSLAAILLFVLFPVFYTIYLGFTNYSSFNLLTYERAREILTARTSIDSATEQPFRVTGTAGAYQVWLPQAGLISAPVALEAKETAALQRGAQPTELLSARDAIKLRKGLQGLTLTAPDGTELQNAGLRSFASLTPDYTRLGANKLERTADGIILTANHDTGFFETPDGETLTPGWRVNVGFGNFSRIFGNAGIYGSMGSIFIWTFVFAALSVVFTFAVGLTLALVLQWEHLRFKSLYRVLLILPYAVPAFISILVFRGLFNQNFGEINLILNALFGLNPDWFTNGTLARIMILIVNTWLGYPYMMLLAMGFLQSIPADQKEAAAIDGAGPVTVVWKIILPQILPPFLPLLLSSFAFNFNNLVLVLLLTRGLPDIPGTVIPAGETDILASFTYRLAFNNSGQEFGLAGAITLLIFLIVAIISYANFVAMRRAASKGDL